MKKSLIASVSIISMIAGLNSDAFAGPVTRTPNVNTDITNGAGFSPNGFNDGDSISFENTCIVSFTTNPNHTINIVDFLGNEGGLLVSDNINIKANNVCSSKGANGFITFKGTSQIDGTIGSGGAINTINIGNGTVNFTSSIINSNNMNFTSKESYVKFTGKSTVSTDFSALNTSGNDGNGRIIIDTNVDFAQTIGGTDASFEAVIFTSDSLMRYRPHKEFFIDAVNIYPDADLGSGNGSLLAWYHGNKDLNHDIGKSDAKLNLVAFSETNPGEGIYDQIVTLKTGKKIYANTIDIYPNNLTEVTMGQTTFNIETNTIVDGHITTHPPSPLIFVSGPPPEFIPILVPGAPDPRGIVNINGSSTMSGGIGESNNFMPEVNFTSTTSSDVVRFTGDIYATNITQASPNLTLTKNSRFSTKNGYNNQNSTHSLGLNTFTIQSLVESPIEDGPMLFQEIKNNNGISGTEVINTTADSSTAGNIVIDGGTFTIGGEGGVTSMTLNLVDLTTTIPVGGKRSYTILGNTVNDGVIIIPDDSIVNFDVLSSTNPFVYWTYSNGVITQIFIPNPAPVIKQAAISAVNNPTTTTISNITIISDSNANVDLANAILAGPVAVTELVDRLLISTTEVTEDSFDTIEGVIGDVSANLNKKTEIALVTVSEPTLQGISAGDAANRYGVWSSYSYSDNTQGARGVKPGYKSKSNSITIGADTLVSDETALGFAVGYIDTNVKHKDSNLGDKSKVKTILISLYSVTELMNNWYIQAQGIFGQSKINNAELRGSFANREIAKAKFKSNVYAASIETGYNFLTEHKIMVTPVVGMEYDLIGKSRYRETGTTNQNLNVRKSDQKKLIAHTGLIIAKNFKVGETNLIPEIYGMIRHDFLNKNLKVNSKLEGGQDSLITRTAQNVPTFYNFGLGVTSIIQNTDVTLGYDYYFGEKYTSHQGSVKLRLNF